MLRNLTRTLISVVTLHACCHQTLAQQSHIHVMSAYLDRIGGATVEVVEPFALPLGPTNETGRVDFNLPLEGQQSITVSVAGNGYISRHAELTWDAGGFDRGFAVTLWREDDLNSVRNIVVHNPNEIAVVLAYDRNQMPAPMVMAKGAGENAVRLNQLTPCARTAARPVLARGLFERAEVGLQVPEEFLAEVIRLFEQLPPRGGLPPVVSGPTYAAGPPIPISSVPPQISQVPPFVNGYPPLGPPTFDNGDIVFPGGNGSGPGGCCLPRWFDVHAEWLFWDIEFSDDIALSSEGILGPTVLSTGDLEINEESGVRVTGALLVGPGTGIEATYFGAFSFGNSAGVTSSGNLYSVFSDFGSDPLNGFPSTDGSNFHGVAISSELDNGEINLRHRWVSANCLIHSSWLVGVRYLRLAEDMIYTTEGVLPAGSPVRVDYVLKTDNDLVGAQIGTDMSICISPRFKIGGEIEAGVYGTHSKQRTNGVESIDGSPAPILREFDSISDVGFVAEAGMMGIFRLTPRMNVRAGYQVLYVSGVALAAQNFNSEPPFSSRQSFINNDGDALYHGATLGFEWTW